MTEDSMLAGGEPKAAEGDWVEGIVAVSRTDGSRIEIKAPEGTFDERFSARVHPKRRVQVRPVADESVGSGAGEATRRAPSAGETGTPAISPDAPPATDPSPPNADAALLVAETENETADSLAHRFAVYAFSIDGLDSLDESSQQVCRDFARWVLRDRAELLSTFAALREDSERLDFLEQLDLDVRGGPVYTYSEMPDARAVWYSRGADPTGDEDRLHLTLRAAIDAAIDDAALNTREGDR